MSIKINSRNFEKEVLESDKLVLLDFWAEWCAPCRKIGPILEEIAEEYPEIKVGKINVDEEAFLTNHFGVQSIPMLVCMKNGKMTNSSIGFMPKEEIVKLFK